MSKTSLSVINLMLYLKNYQSPLALAVCSCLHTGQVPFYHFNVYWFAVHDFSSFKFYFSPSECKMLHRSSGTTM